MPLADQLEQANINYWAYWVGEIDGIQVDDEFMVRGQLLQQLPTGFDAVRVDEGERR